ncbi:peptidoglycan-binding protein [Streptomyces sp. MAR4 CNX-425]|uniref:peptidoglycan-binding protein n=1 Tax=Streptomyces sp. MAR4 CNX-425 TaxID=3406343 RepID=UPI003B502AED
MTGRETTEEPATGHRSPGAPGPVAAGAPAGAGTAGDPGTDTAAASAATAATPAATPAATGADAPAPAPRRRRARTALVVVAAIGVAAAAGLAATGALGGENPRAPAAGPSGPAATARVERTTLTSSETVQGTLGYGDVTTVQAIGPPGGDASADAGTGAPAQNGAPEPDPGGDAAGEGAGIVTWMPDEGTTIERGDTVYAVDGAEIPLFYGETPLYRTLADGSEGGDVEMLERNLAKLGYTGFTVDATYTPGTAAAVSAWQADTGREETGAAGPGDAVTADGARRVAGVQTWPGARAEGAVLDWTGTERVVTVELDAQFEDLVRVGTQAAIELPNGTAVDGEVTAIGTPPTAGSPASGGAGGGGGEGEEDEAAALPLRLEVARQDELGRYQAAPVDVVLSADTREDVLAVPVNALVARQGGGYAVQKVTAGGTEYVPVELGMFADGLVEVSGDGVAEGMSVGVPK